MKCYGFYKKGLGDLKVPLTPNMTSESYVKFDWLDVFPKPIKLHITSGIHIDVIVRKVYSTNEFIFFHIRIFNSEKVDEAKVFCYKDILHFY